MNRHQKELRLAELTVSRDILNQQIEAIRRELASDGLQIWKDQQNNYIPSAECPVCHHHPSIRGGVNVGKTGYPDVIIPCSHPCHGQDR